jgi:hypothetical protein
MACRSSATRFVGSPLMCVYAGCDLADLSVLQRGSHQLGVDGRILVRRKAPGSFESIGASDKHAHRSARVHRNPTFVRLAGTSAARDDGGLDPLAPGTRETLDVEYRQRLNATTTDVAPPCGQDLAASRARSVGHF